MGVSCAVRQAMRIARLTNLRGIVRSSEDELGRPVVSRADVRDVRLVLHQNLCTSEVAELEDASARVEEQILRLDVAMADTLGMDVCQSSEKLLDVQLDLENWHRRLHLVEEPRGAVNSLWHKLLYQVEVYLIFLLVCQRQLRSEGGRWREGPSYAFAVRIVECLELDNVRVADDPHDLKLTVLPESAHPTRPPFRAAHTLNLLS